MRIDEFSKPDDIDGSISATEQSRFMLFGFDISISITHEYNIEVIFGCPEIGSWIDGAPKINNGGTCPIYI